MNMVRDHELDIDGRCYSRERSQPTIFPPDNQHLSTSPQNPTTDFAKNRKTAGKPVFEIALEVWRRLLVLKPVQV